MTDSPPSEYAARSEDIANRIVESRTIGGWMLWAGFAAAIVWWGASAGATLAHFGVDALAAQPPGVYGGLAIAILLPGALLFLAGVMARESRRSAAANAIVMEAASRLLTPTRETGREAELFAEMLARNVAQVNEATTAALASLKSMSDEIADERLRFESVAYTAADNGRDLAERLSQERQALESIARDIRAQTDGMSEAIPRQAKAMVDAARSAAEDVAATDSALEGRLKSLDRARDMLTGKLAELDRLADESTKRAEALNFSVAKVEEKLDASRKTIDTAAQASEMAVAAAGSVGDRLQEAVVNALDEARKANNEITAASEAASKQAADILANLHRSSAQSVSAIQTASGAARSETDHIARRLNEIKEGFARLADQAAAVELGPSAASAGRRPTGPAEPLDELFDEDEEVEAAPEAAERPPAPRVVRSRSRTGRSNGGPPVRAATPPAAPQPASLSDHEQTAWRDILADLDDGGGPANGAGAPAPGPELPREATAESLIARLQDSGVKLPQTFRPKDKKKIAAAARKGDDERRSTTRDLVGREVERVSIRLNKDEALRALAQSFLSMEADDALKALEDTQKSGRFASPRLSAYLLVDAALGEAGQNAF
ncbi:MAG: hypothetical protein AAFX03_05560 [Pseudomonadota bacterium]